jgi:hypothetical protein
MEPLPDWAPEGADPTQASAARIYDYYLGGAHNFAVDRELADQAIAAHPEVRTVAIANRAFLQRSVRYLLGRGVRQFIDIGAGIPTGGNVHEIAQETDPGARVLYVDHDPVAVAHAELILQDDPNTRVLQADLRRPDEILDAVKLGGLLDLSRPIAVLLVAVLHFVPESDRPDLAIAALRDLLPAGSYLVICQVTPERLPDPESNKVTELYRSTATPVVFRTRERIRELFAGWDLVEPGVVWVPEWHPDWPEETWADPADSHLAAGVGVKPGPPATPTG